MNFLCLIERHGEAGVALPPRGLDSTGLKLCVKCCDFAVSMLGLTDVFIKFGKD